MVLKPSSHRQRGGRCVKMAKQAANTLSYRGDSAVNCCSLASTSKLASLLEAAHGLS